MALSNQQYESIIRQYGQIQDENRRILGRRREEVYRKIPSFEALEDRTREISLEKARQLLEAPEDESVLSSLHDALMAIAAQKKTALRDAGFPEDYLEPIYTCPDCQDTGYMLGADQTRVKCHCFRNREIAILYEQSNIQYMLSTENFSTLSYSYYQGEDLEHFEKAVEICKNFIQNFKQDYHNLFFYGTVGTGKSFLSSCIAAQLLEEGHSVIYFSAFGLFETLARFSFDGKTKEALYNFYEDLYNCELLIIDDLGTEMTNAFVSSQFFSCLNERRLRRKATIISTNLSLGELRDRYSERIFSRITSNYTLCKLTGQDIRMAKKRGARP